jgi:hypothetical protein
LPRLPATLDAVHAPMIQVSVSSYRYSLQRRYVPQAFVRPRRCRGERWPLRVEHIIDGKNDRIQQVVANQVADRHVTMARAMVPSG